MMKINKKAIKVGILCLLVCSLTPVYADTPWLHTDANLIKDPDGLTVVLGVSIRLISVPSCWYAAACPALIDMVTNKSDSQGNSPGWYTKVIRLAVYPAQETDFSSPFTFDPNDSYRVLL